MTFTISIEKWATDVSMIKLPVCEISSSVEITNALADFDAFSAEELIIENENERHVTSFILWNASRAHADIGDITVTMHNLEDRVGILLYSKTTKFSVDGVVAMHDKDVWHSFVVMSGNEKIVVQAV